MTTRFMQEKTEEWYLLDAQDCVLGRFASEVAVLLRGKHRPYYSPHQECGDFIVVLNVEKIRLTGNKEKDKKYYRYSRQPGHKKERGYQELNEKKPGEALRLAVRGMLPKTHLGRKMLQNLRIYVGEEHPHQAQQPSLLSFNDKGRVVIPKLNAKIKSSLKLAVDNKPVAKPDVKSKPVADVASKLATESKPVASEPVAGN